MRRLTQPTKATEAYLRKRDELHKNLRKFIRETRKAQREQKAKAA